MKNANKQWTAGIELRGGTPPPPPPHHHMPGPKPHEVIIDGLEAISEQIAELSVVVEEIRAGRG